MATYQKGDQEQLNYAIDYTNLLPAGATIASSSWTVPAGITKEAEEFSTTATSIVLSGGTIKEVYKLVNVITTTGIPNPPIFERSFFVVIVEDKFK